MRNRFRTAAWLIVGSCLLAGSCANVKAKEAEPAVTGIKAGSEILRVATAGAAPSARLVELRPYEAYKAGGEWPVVWQGRLAGQAIEVPRFDGPRDRLYAKFQLVDATSGRPLGSPHYADDLADVPARDTPLTWPKSVKGITCPVDLEDLQHLGVKYVNTNMSLNQLLDWRSKDPKEVWDVDGEKIGIHSGYVAQLDRQIKRMTDLGINVTLVINNSVPTSPDPANPLIHPQTDLAAAPQHLGAFNCTDERGLRHYRAAIEYMANRYSDPNGEHGRVSGYIVGNELQAHWVWYNMGRIGLDDLVRDYARTLRVSYLAVRRFHRDLRVYVSMDHHWTARQGRDPMQGVRGTELLERLAAETRAEGDFPWHVAFHPYPENLFEPRFWNDRTAPLALDAPRITFKNIEVLPAFLRQARFLYRGRPRRIILSEQGFHCPDGPDGEAVQAAAYAYAYHKVSHIPEIDAFMLHRHVDHRGEGGLRLGLWSCKQDGPDPSAPDRKRLLWQVFRDADTPRWRDAFRFALPVIGIKDWGEALPAREIAQHARPERRDVKGLIVDLLQRMDDAEVADCADWRPAWVKGEDGKERPSIFQHPPTTGTGVGKATFTIPLPRAAAGRRILLRFSIAVTGAEPSGVGFAVLVDGRKVWSARQKTAAPVAHAVDLTPHAGRTVRLTLQVDALGDTTYDWANWVDPVIVFDPPE